MCNKCEIFHSKLCQNHHSFKLDQAISEIFTVFCMEENHNDQLEFFCKTHNVLCCGLCLCKIKKNGKGKHKDCDVCTIEDIKEEKKNKLKENYKILKDFSGSLDQSINELKLIFEKINQNKEDLKLKIQKVFTKIRNALNQREDELLLEVDKKFDDIYFNEDIFKNYDKLSDKVKISLEKGNIEENEWNNNSKLNSIIYNCINIENNIKDINKIIKKIKKNVMIIIILKLNLFQKKKMKLKNF